MLDTGLSTISQHIAALESSLHTVLFNRITQILSPTDEGAVFCKNALSALAALDDAKASVGNLGKVEGTVCISMPLTLAESHIIPLVATFLESRPANKLRY
jgi:LysR family transcriptional regulator, regulator for bpeEF and oprC